MPRVPTYDNFQVAPGSLPGARLDAPDTSGIGSVPARQLQDVGQGLVQAGGAVGRIALDKLDQANQARVADTLNRAVDADTTLRIEALALRGRNALERPDGKALPDEYGERLDKALSALGDELGNDAQKYAFRTQAAQMRQQFRKAITGHLIDQQREFERETDAATISTAQNRGALLWGDRQALAQATGAIAATIDQMAMREGWDDKTREAKLVEAMNPLHFGVLKSMLDIGKTDAARAYYDANSSQMTIDARAGIMRSIEIGEADHREQEGAATLWAKHGGNLSAALAEARTTFKGKEEDGVVQRLKVYDAERVQLRERGQRDAGDRAWRIYADTGSVSRIPPTILAAMDGKDLEALRRTARTEAQGREVKTDPDIYYALSLAAANDPNFAKEDLRRYFDRLSPADRKHFINLQAKARDPENAPQVVSLEAQKSAMVKALGIKGEDAGRFYQAADRELYAEQKEKGRALTQEERQRVLDRLALKGEVLTGKWWRVDRNTRLYDATLEGEAGAFRPEFSDADVRKATAALARRGIQKPTQEQIDAVIRAAYGVK